MTSANMIQLFSGLQPELSVNGTEARTLYLRKAMQQLYSNVESIAAKLAIDLDKHHAPSSSPNATWNEFKDNWRMGQSRVYDILVFVSRMSSPSPIDDE